MVVLTWSSRAQQAEVGEFLVQGQLVYVDSSKLAWTIQSDCIREEMGGDMDGGERGGEGSHL